MTVRDVDGIATDRLAIVENLIADNPGCAVGVLDVANNIGDPKPLLATMGISSRGHPPLAGGALVEFVATTDAWLVSDINLAARRHGSAMRKVRLRNGTTANLHVVDVNGSKLRSVVLIAPLAGETITTTPPPTAVVASARVGVIQCDAFGTITTACASTLALLGRSSDAVVGQPIINLLHPEDQDASIVNWVAAKEQRGVALRWRCRVLRPDRSPLWVEVTLTYEIDTTGAGDVRVDLYDISQEVAATEALAAETELLVLLTETLPVGVAKFDASGRIELANRRLTQLLEPVRPHELLGQAARGELANIDLAAAFRSVLHDGAMSLLTIEHIGRDGTSRHLEWTIRPVHTDAGTVTGGVICVADVTEAHDLRAALEHRASTDTLTGCLNRAGTIASLESALATGGPDHGVGLLFIDLDGFKHINDLRGHAVGDAVLEIVAGRLRLALRAQDLLGRLGGDEFVVIAPRLRSAAAALLLAERIAGRLQGFAAIGDAMVAIEASIGVAWTSTGTATDLLGSADGAMYTAKQANSSMPVLATT